MQGFILTRQHRDTPDGVTLVFWLYTEYGPRKIEIANQESVAFIRSCDEEHIQALLKQHNIHGVRIAPLDLRNFAQEPVSGLYCKKQSTLFDVIHLLQDNHIPISEEDIRPSERFMMERFIRAGVDIPNNHSLGKPSYIKPNLSVVSLDIETAYDGNDLYCIGLSQGDMRIVMMCGEGKNTDLIEYYPTERALLNAFIKWVERFDPDVFIGWNVIQFDFRFLQKKFEQYRISPKLGRNGETLHWRQSNEGNHYFISIPGRLVLDGIDSLKAGTYQFESFSLEFVSRTLLGDGKKVHDVDHRAEEIKNLYHDDPIALAEYNIQDCVLVERIFEHTGILDYLIERAYLTGLPLDKTAGSTASFDNLYLPLLHRSGYVAPAYNSGASGLNAPGGYVMDSKPGLYEHVLVLDFKSLYPSIIRTFLVDPMGLAEGLVEDDPDKVLAGFNHAKFSRKNHHLPNLITQLWAARDKAKSEDNAAVSQAIKIIMNSFYGVLGSPICRFFDQRLSSSITLRGHDILQKSKHWIEEQGHTVIYGDTDSVFVWIQKSSHQDIDALGHGLADGLNEWWQNKLEENLGIESHLEIEFETHYHTFFMPTIRGSDKGSKKRYCGEIIKDGESQLVFKGLESVRTDWTPLAREFQTKLFELLFSKGNWQDYLTETVEALLSGNSDGQLVYRKRLRRKLDDYQRNIPPQVQAAKKAEAYLKENGLPSKYQNGGWIQYVITLNGPEPLEFNTSQLDYQHYIDKQLAPIADAILPLIGEQFQRFSDPQMGLL